MARSCGGGSSRGRSGGSSRSSSSSSSFSSSDSYSINCPHRHCYVNRHGVQKVYYTKAPIDIDKKQTGVRLFSILLVLMFMLSWGFFFLAAVVAVVSDVKYGNTKLTAYDADAVVLEDNAGLFDSSEIRELTISLREFGEKTGIIPYVYTLNGETLDMEQYLNESKLEQFAMDKYYELFSDENHFLIVYMDNSVDWVWWAIQGDNTYPLLNGEEFGVFRDTLTDALSITTESSALLQAFDTKWIDSITHVSVKDIKGYASVILFSSVSPLILILLIYGIVEGRHEAVDEYNYYRDHGYPMQVDEMLDRCPNCGYYNVNHDERCSNCGASMYKNI